MEIVQTHMWETMFNLMTLQQITESGQPHFGSPLPQTSGLHHHKSHNMHNHEVYNLLLNQQHIHKLSLLN